MKAAYVWLGGSALVLVTGILVPDENWKGLCVIVALFSLNAGFLVKVYCAK